MKRKSLKHLKILIGKDINYCKSFIEYATDKSNPQVIEMRIKNEARLEALEDVLRYINNGEEYMFNKRET